MRFHQTAMQAFNGQIEIVFGNDQLHIDIGKAFSRHIPDSFDRFHS
jgi:hypothetical protein